MKRLYIAVALLLVVVAIAYIKSARGTARQQQAFELGQAENRQQLTALQQNVDSLKRLLELQSEAYADSIASGHRAYRHDINRLVKFLDSAIARPKLLGKPQTAAPSPTTRTNNSVKPRDKEAVEEKPSQARQAEADAPPKVTASEPVADDEPITDAVEAKLKEQVLTHYGKLYESLPKDLSSQERKVALYEISLKTAAEFSITMPQLKAICEHYYLSY
ncbi:MAG: hypothetical protein KAW46_01095 [candidate division Zixibacteria bacterium]|nr:hypothetical protein [candidate division Zixibacteria bacterium]